MHTTILNVFADQEIEIKKQNVNIHDLESITVNGNGVIVGYSKKEYCPSCKTVLIDGTCHWVNCLKYGIQIHGRQRWNVGG